MIVSGAVNGKIDRQGAPLLRGGIVLVQCSSPPPPIAFCTPGEPKSVGFPNVLKFS